MKSSTNYLLRISGCVALLAALLSMLAAPAEAASLEGMVIYGTGGVPYALVSVYQETTGRKIVTRTNSDGRYLFNGIPDGSYIVLVEKDGKRIYQGRVNALENPTRFDIRL